MGLILPEIAPRAVIETREIGVTRVMSDVFFRKLSPGTASLWMSLSCLALVAGCKPGEGPVDLSGYLSQHGAPAPVDSSALAAFFANAMLPGVVTQTAALFATDARYRNQSRNGWSNPIDPQQPLNGRVYNPLRSSGAAFAHVAGLRGTGSTIAVSDDQYLVGYAELAGANVVVVNNWDYLFPGDDDPTGHGTIVSAVALGDSADFIGTAPDARLIFGSFETYQKLANLGNTALNYGAVAWNNSWGFKNSSITQADFNATFNSSQGGRNYLTALDNFAASSVVVFAVSNDYTAQHSGLLDGLPYLRPSLEAGWIAAVNGVPTFSGGDVSSVQLLSSSCLEAARWCMIADGTWRIPDVSLALERGDSFVTGSSFAAPQISGAMALLQNAFPMLTPHELRVRLLASADDGFFTADDTVELATGFNKGYSVTYGHGFLDIEAALKPIGGTAMSLASGGAVATNAPVLQTGSAFGDAVEMSLASTDVLVKDALSAGFVMPAGALTAGARPGSRAIAMLSRDLSSNLTVERMADETALADPFAAFGGNKMDLTTADGALSASVLMPRSGTDSMGINLTRVLTDGPTRIEVGLKLARDDGRMLSLDGSDQAMLASVSFGVAQDLGANAFLALTGEVGMTDLGGSTAFGGVGSAQFDSASLRVRQRDVFTDGDRLTLGVAMPVAVASGQTMVNLPVYREAAALASFEAVPLNLAPESRQVDFEISYQTALADGLEMKLSLAHSENFGNRANEVDQGGAIAFTFQF